MCPMIRQSDGDDSSGQLGVSDLVIAGVVVVLGALAAGDLILSNDELGTSIVLRSHR